MKCLHIITGLNTGGAEKALSRILAGGLAEHQESIVLSLKDEGTMGGEIQENGAAVHTLGLRSGLSGVVAIKRLRQLVRNVQPDVIQGWMYHGNLAANLAGFMAKGSPAVSWNVRHSLYDLNKEKPLTRQVIRVSRGLSRFTDSIIYNSQLSKHQHESFGFRANCGHVIPNGFHLPDVRSIQSSRQQIRDELGLASNEFVVGHVARFHPLKDHRSFLAASVQVAKKMPNVRFLLVGREVSLKNPAFEGIVPPELAHRFVFLGERKDVHRLMSVMDAFCLSSASEAFPNVLGEAMATGVPCITTDVGDAADIVGDTGLVVPPSNSDVLARGILTMTSKSHQERDAMGLAARQRIEERYSLETVVRQYCDLYEELVRRPI